MDESAMDDAVAAMDEMADAQAAAHVEAAEMADAPAAEEPMEAPAAEPPAAEASSPPAPAAEVAAEPVVPAPRPVPAPRVYEGPEPTTMEELLNEQATEIRSLKHGDVVEGNVVRIDKDEILVDIGAKAKASSATASCTAATPRASRS